LSVNLSNSNVAAINEGYKMSRTKQVGNGNFVVDTFAAQTQEHARTPNNSVYFHGNVLFSYGNHYVIAKLDGKTALVNSTDSSITTNKYAHAASLTLQGSYAVISVANPMASSPAEHDANMDDLKERLSVIQGLRSRARSDRIKSIHLDNAQRLESMIRDYYDYVADNKPEFAAA